MAALVWHIVKHARERPAAADLGRLQSEGRGLLLVVLKEIVERPERAHALYKVDGPPATYLYSYVEFRSLPDAERRELFKDPMWPDGTRGRPTGTVGTCWRRSAHALGRRAIASTFGWSTSSRSPPGPDALAENPRPEPPRNPLTPHCSLGVFACSKTTSFSRPEFCPSRAHLSFVALAACGRRQRSRSKAGIGVGRKGSIDHAAVTCGTTYRRRLATEARASRRSGTEIWRSVERFETKPWLLRLAIAVCAIGTEA